jgi:cell division protein FtsQ
MHAMNTTDITSRFNRRRLVTRLVAMRPVIVAVLVVGALAFFGWVVFFSPWLAAEDVTVEGARTVSAHDVEQAAAVPVGTPLARVDLGKIRSAVAKLPAVSSVVVHRSWPHTISIAITERQPVASVYRAGDWWEVDESGVLFRESGSRPPALPVVAVKRSAVDDLLPEAAGVAAALSPDLAAETRRVTASSIDSVTVHLKDGSVVMWGSSAESDRKVEVLKALMVHSKAATFNVSVPGQPTTSQ